MLFLARHGFPYVGRMSGMSGAPDFMGHHAGRMEGHGPDAGPWEAWRGARHTGRPFPWRLAFAGFMPGLRPPCGAGTAAMPSEVGEDSREAKAGRE